VTLARCDTDNAFWLSNECLVLRFGILLCYSIFLGGLGGGRMAWRTGRDSEWWGGNITRCSEPWQTVLMTIKHEQGVQASKVVPSPVKSYPYTGLDRPLGFQKVGHPTFPDNPHMKVVRCSALRTSRLYTPPPPPGSIPGTHFCFRKSRPYGHSHIEVSIDC
jgi:hypothetical protein